MKEKLEILSSYYPEVNISGYTSCDGTVEFYARINSLVDSSMTVLDFGAGRAAWNEDDPCSYRKSLRNMKGKVKKVVGCDVDDAIHLNNSIDEKIVIEIGKTLPFEDESFDLIVCDYTFEHVANPDEVAGEFYRILKNGGWVCARTPNKYSYISVLTRIIKNSHHTNILKYAQPDRKEIDVFPTTFKLNSIRDISKHFDKTQFDNLTYRYEAEPSYYFNNRYMFVLMMLVNKLLPSLFKSNLFIFLRKK
jgi:SAM-dependent methyltransferase